MRVTQKDPGGRPRRKIDLAQLEKLGELHCTLDDVAAFFGVATTLIDERMAEHKLYRYGDNRLTFREIFQRGKAQGRTSLRRKQMEMAAQGNPTMLIWLGKQLLGQRDQIEHSGELALDAGRNLVEILNRSVAEAREKARLAEERLLLHSGTAAAEMKRPA